jgi:hypothetical protein
MAAHDRGQWRAVVNAENKTLGSIKRGGISRLAEWLFVSEDGHCSIKLTANAQY